MRCITLIPGQTGIVCTFREDILRLRDWFRIELLA